MRTASRNCGIGSRMVVQLLAFPLLALTACAATEYAATDVPKSIPDLGMVRSVLQITAPGRILDVNVKVNVSHSFDADLDVLLIAPDGTRVELFTDVGGSGDDFRGTVLDDDAPASITAGTAPFAGAYRPEGALAILDGKDLRGTWTLEVTDDTAADSGALNSWSLIVETTGGGDNVVRYHAVICGVADYPGYEYDLDYCDDDARDIRDALIVFGNWSVSNIGVKIDAAATKGAIRQAIQQMGQRADADDVCVVSFSGHGTTGLDEYPFDESDWYDEYLVPYDGIYYDWLWDEYVVDYDNCISDDEFGDWMAALPTRKYVVVMDSCFSGGHLKALGRGAVKGIGDVAPTAGDGFAADFVNRRSPLDLNDNGFGVVLAACADDETAEERSSLRNGVFTFHLVAAITNLAADVNGDRCVSAEEAYAYARSRTTSLNPAQHPQLFDGHAGDLPLVSSVAAVRYFGWSAIGSSQYADYPFPVAVTARDGNGAAAAGFSNAVILTGCAVVGSTNRSQVRISPTSTARFTSGVWTGSITVLDPGTSVVLVAQETLGATGDSPSFDVSALTRKGTPTRWLVTNGLKRSSSPLADEMDDADSDGAPNWQEYAAGTDPNDSASALRVRDLHRLSGSRLTMSFQSVYGRIYRVQRTVNMIPPSWTSASYSTSQSGAMQMGLIVAFGNLTTIYVEPSDECGFYRVAVE